MFSEFLSSRRLLARPAAAAFFIFISSALVCAGDPTDPDESTAERTDPVAQLKEALEEDRIELDSSDRKEWLRDVLGALGVPVESQTLVFTKTSLQNRFISPATPRAIYFSEEVYVGWPQGSDMIELIAHDPNLGPVFYAIRRPDSPDSLPEFDASSSKCLSCHEGARTRDVPGPVVRSVYPDDAGQPITAVGSYVTTHESPFEERWGGWYVTGRHGRARHMGNVLADWDRDHPHEVALDRDAGANRESLDGLVQTDAYLRDDSDIVALMVLEHQTGMHNRLTEANMRFKNALQFWKALNPEAPEPASVSEIEGSALSVAESYSEKVVEHLLFKDEAPLPDGGISGGGDFEDAFRRGQPESRSGDGLKDFRLLGRIFKNRCSYMIYSSAFDSLHPVLKEVVYRRLWEILTGRDTSAEYAHLSESERERIQEILVDTIDDLPAYWRAP